LGSPQALIDETLEALPSNWDDAKVEPALSRTAWRQIETVHAVTYFCPECREAPQQLGLRGFWMGYFGNRAAPMGAVSAGVVEAVFYNFHPSMVRRAIPDAWDFATPEAILSARSLAAATAIRRLAPEATELCDQLLPLLRTAIDHGNGAGRPLFATNRDLVGGSEGLGDAWQAATTMREHRGDGHVAVLLEAEVDGCEAHVLFAATEGVPSKLLQDSRGWSITDWAEATERLQRRGMLDSVGQCTGAGRRLRQHIEQRTDELAVQPYAVLRNDEMDKLIGGLSRIARPIMLSGAIPFPNPMGLPNVGAA
jgi:hypothetical protein